jgi:biopolymer transport protein ExbD
MKNPFRSNPRNASIQTSSLADIAFLLIVFFLLTTFIAMTKGIYFKPVPADGDGIKVIPGIHLYINKNGKFFIDGRLSKISDIKPYLSERLSVNPMKPVIIHCSVNQEYQKMMEILDEVKKTESEMYDKFNSGKTAENQKHIHVHIPASSEGDQYIGDMDNI